MPAIQYRAMKLVQIRHFLVRPLHVEFFEARGKQRKPRAGIVDCRRVDGCVEDSERFELRQER